MRLVTHLLTLRSLSLLVLVAVFTAFNPPFLPTQSVIHAQTEPLPAPTLTAEAAGATTVELNWEAVANAARYELWAWDSVNGWQSLGGDSLTGTTYTHENLTAGTTYFYQMRALDASGAGGAWSERVQVTPGALPASVLTAEASDAATVELGWTAVDGAARYELWAWDSVNGWQRLDGDSLTGTTYTHENLTAGTTYYYSIRALNAAGEAISAWSAYVSATPGALPAPVLTAEPAGAATVELSWTAVDGAARYELWAWDSVNDWYGIGGDSLTGTTYTHANLTAGTTYKYAIRAVDANGVGGVWSTNVSAATEAVSVPNPDRAALVALYNAAGGASWKNNTNWLSEEPLNSWHGVTADGDGRVTALNLSDNKLSGTIPSQLGALANLTGLWLQSSSVEGGNPDRNQLSGSIPPALGNLANLTRLDLAGNQLSGTIPSALGNLSNLTFLYLWNNQLSGAIPSQLGALSNLTHLALAENQLSGTVSVLTGQPLQSDTSEPRRQSVERYAPVLIG